MGFVVSTFVHELVRADPRNVLLFGWSKMCTAATYPCAYGRKFWHLMNLVWNFHIVLLLTSWNVVCGEIMKLEFCVEKEKSCHVLQYAGFGYFSDYYNCFLLGSVIHHTMYWLVTAPLLMSLESMWLGLSGIKISVWIFVNTVVTRRAVNSNFCFTQANCVQVSERVVSHGFHFRPTIRSCTLTEERMDKISGFGGISKIFCMTHTGNGWW
jgi:hypothetical protein